jgi:hypothetical protein
MEITARTDPVFIIIIRIISLIDPSNISNANCLRSFYQNSECEWNPKP